MSLCPIAYWQYTSKRDYKRVLAIVRVVLVPLGLEHVIDDGKVRGGWRIQVCGVPYSVLDQIKDMKDQAV